MNSHRGRGRGRGIRGSRYVQKSEQPSGPSPSTPLPVMNKNLNVISIDLELDEVGSQWMSQLRSNWNFVKNSPIVVNTVLRRFEQSSNPYEETLRIMYNCPDFKYAKPKSLAMFVLEQFKRWSSQVRTNIIHLLTTELKISAFNVVRQQNNFSMMKLVAEVYEMFADCDIFFDIIQSMIQQKQYKEACQSVALLRLHKKFGIDEFLVPLILQDKAAVVEDFLADSVDHQTELVSFLDLQLGTNTSVRLTWDSYIHEHQIPEIKYDKMHFKSFRKVVTRYKKLYNLPDEITPNLIKKQNEGALQFLLHRRYVKNAIGDESFKEMVHEAVQSDKYLQLELVVLAAQHGDIDAALHFAHLYSVPKQDWPYSVRMYYDNPDNGRQRAQLVLYEEEIWDDPIQAPVEYYKLRLPMERIYLVDSHEEFDNFLENSLRHTNIVGIDCEWKPSFGSQKNELALMQIATRSEVVILDVIQLGAGAACLWEKLGALCFNNCDMLKLGFGLISDMSMIGKSLPHTNISQKIGFLDLLHVWRQIEKQGIKLPHDVQSGGPSLSTLVHQCFGAALNKADQFSNWEKRPLRASQLEYAALDAYCLIEIYDVLKQCCENTRFNFDEACFNLMSSSNSSLKKSKKGLHKKKTIKPALEQPPNTDFPPVDASDIAFVCDTMLQGLGKLLRKCGISTTILDNTDDHMQCLKIYQNERRYILTRGQTFAMFYGSVPKGHCFNIVHDDLEEQLSSVLEYYKITVRKEHVFSICQACDGNSFMKLSQSTMQTLAKNANFGTGNARPAGYYLEDQDDEATGFTSEEEIDDDYYMTAKLPPPPPSRKWELCSDEPVDVGLCRLRNGVKILVQMIPEGVLEKQEMYYVCEKCGKVYWDGSHFERVLSGKLQKIVL